MAVVIAIIYRLRFQYTLLCYSIYVRKMYVEGAKLKLIITAYSCYSCSLQSHGRPSAGASAP